MHRAERAHDHVVGAGSASCVPVDRLSAVGSVLLLEAGEPDDRRELRVPLGFGDVLRAEDSPVD